MGCFVVGRFLLTSASHGPSAIAELLVIFLSVAKQANNISHTNWFPKNYPQKWWWRSPPL